MRGLSPVCRSRTPRGAHLSRCWGRLLPEDDMSPKCSKGPRKCKSDTDLITEAEALGILSANDVEAILAHRRHHEYPDGTRFWLETDFLDLYGIVSPIEGGVTSD